MLSICVTKMARIMFNLTQCMAAYHGTDIVCGDTPVYRSRYTGVSVVIHWCIVPAQLVYVHVERSGSGVELQTLDYENPGSNPGCGVKTLGKFFHSTLLQFTQLNK